LSTTKLISATSIAAAMVVTTVCYAWAQSSGAPGPRARDITYGADLWDSNHDGIYTCDEWKSYLDRTFKLADTNRDGHLDKTEFGAIRKPGTVFADADFGYFDENQDGKIARDEFVGKPNEFILRNDKNGDCRVTPEEMMGTSDAQKMPNRHDKRF